MFTIISDEPELLDPLRRYAATSATAMAKGSLGFKIAESSAKGGLWTLVGMDGGVLARDKNAARVVDVLERHLVSLTSLSPDIGSARVALRAVVGPTGDAVLVDPRLLRVQPVIERSYARHGLSLADALFTDIKMFPGRKAPLRAGEVGSEGGILGHDGGASINVTKVRAVLWPADAEAPELTLGQSIHAIAASIRNGDRGERLQRAVTLTDSIPAIAVQRHEKGSLLSALVEQLQPQRPSAPHSA